MTNLVTENENQHKTDINTKWREHIIQASLNFVKKIILTPGSFQEKPTNYMKFGWVIKELQYKIYQGRGRFTST